MPTQVTYPGVYIEEVPSGVRPVTAVATSNGAFVGFFKEGPTDKAVEVNGMADFNRIFGGLSRRSEAAYAIAQFFLNGGAKAYVVRVVTRDEVTAGGVTYPGASTARATAKGGTDSGADHILELTARSSGTGGNRVRATVDPSPTDEQGFHLTLRRYGSTDDDASVVGVEGPYLNLSVNPGSGRYFRRVLDEESLLVSAAHPIYKATTDPADYKSPAVTGTIGKWKDAPNNFKTWVTGVKGKDMSLYVRLTTDTTPDDISAKHEVTVQWGTANSDEVEPENMRQFRRLLERTIRSTPAAGSEAPHPSVAGISVELLERVSNGTAQFCFRLRTDRGWSHIDGTGYSPHEYVHVANSELADSLGFQGGVFNVQEYTLGTAIGFDHRGQATAKPNNPDPLAPAIEGQDGYTPDPMMEVEDDAGADIAAALMGDPEEKTGLYALEDADLFNILCIPVAAKLPANEMTAVVSTALSYCEDRRAFMIVDIPKKIDAIQEMKDWMEEFADFRTSYAATYFPRLLIPDAEDGFKKRSFGASGTVAGIYARTDATRGVWKAPAGLDAGLEGVSELDYRMTDPENGSLNPIGINCIRVFPIHGKVVWGARTLDGADVQASEWKYVPIRRLALMIEESLYRGTRWVVFQPNDEPTWAKVRQNVGAFMFNLFRQGAFQGSTPKQAFYVKCDGQTTTAIDRNLGIVNIEVGFAPLKPAEFVVIKIQQIPDIV